MISIAELFAVAGLAPVGPVPWKEPCPEVRPGIYVVVIDDVVVYIGRTMRPLTRRINEFYRHRYAVAADRLVRPPDLSDAFGDAAFGAMLRALQVRRDMLFGPLLVYAAICGNAPSAFIRSVTGLPTRVLVQPHNRIQAFNCYAADLRRTPFLYE